MGHAHGYRAGTRHSFSRPFRQHGVNIGLTQYSRSLRLGDYVDIAVNGSVHKGMPYKLYHGRTGIVYNVSRRAVGVEFNKQVRNRIVKKRISVRVEHIQPSKCRKDFLDRVQRNEQVGSLRSRLHVSLDLLVTLSSCSSSARPRRQRSQ
jgi:large subunit ribosomal protein L21e